MGNRESRGKLTTSAYAFLNGSTLCRHENVTILFDVLNYDLWGYYNMLLVFSVGWTSRYPTIFTCASWIFAGLLNILASESVRVYYKPTVRHFLMKCTNRYSFQLISQPECIFSIFVVNLDDEKFTYGCFFFLNSISFRSYYQNRIVFFVFTYVYVLYLE